MTRTLKIPFEKWKQKQRVIPREEVLISMNGNTCIVTVKPLKIKILKNENTGL